MFGSINLINQGVRSVSVHLPTQSESQPTTTVVSSVRVEHMNDAIAIGVAKPRLSWIVSTDMPDWQQSAYAIELYGSDGTLREQTTRTISAQSVLIEWPFAPLESRERVTVRVQVWDAHGAPTAWSAPTGIEVGLLNVDDWTAQFITPTWEEDISSDQPCPFLRREFNIRADVRQARLYITALGVYEAQINGAVIGDQVFAPGWTSYSHRLRYQIFDVTTLLHEGSNAIGAILGDGWYRGRLAWEHQRNIYGSQLALFAQLEIEYNDGTSQRIISDESWRATTGPILATSIYDGETYDARRELGDWSNAAYDDHTWLPVQIIERDQRMLVAPTGPPVRCTEVIAPIAISTTPSGRILLDFGQNLVGRLRFTVQGQAGQTITIRHAEVLEAGELCLRPLRTAKATNHYTLRGGTAETWEPRFTFHGFRYADIEGWPGAFSAEAVQALVYHSDMQRTGWFECSDPLINRLHENVVWGMRGNFFDVPTDCPQRDERLGWTGDIQVFAPTASFLYDCAGLLESWLGDLAAEQATYNGVVPHVVPNVLGPPSAAAAWGDAAVVVPWVLYQRFGDRGLLEAQYESMRTWVDAVAKRAGTSLLWDQGFQYGDWLDPSAPPEQAALARTNSAIVATAYFAHSSQIVGEAATVLGRSTDAAHYNELATAIRAAFVQAYVGEHGVMTSDAETAYALALEFALLPTVELRQQAAAHLSRLVRASGYHIGTGFVGTPLVCDALSKSGQLADAYALVLQQECPSWLYPVTMGATTIWERWDSLLPDGSVNPGSMTSFNHYALGAVADWLHRTVGGFAPAAPGYREIRIAPQPGGGLTSATVRHHTPYGLAACTWQIAAETIRVEVTVPPNTTAHVTLPGSDKSPFVVGAGTTAWSYPYDPTTVT